MKDQDLPISDPVLTVPLTSGPSSATDDRIVIIASNGPESLSAMPTADLKRAALDLAAHGLFVLPCKPKSKEPACPNGLHDATTKAAQIGEWWDSLPNANIGIACEKSGLVAIDVDPRHGGIETLAELEREVGALPRTVETKTGGPDGGKHLVFRAPEGARFVGQLGHGLDVRHNAYVVAPPSVHPHGGVYRWENSPFDTEIANLPPLWFAEMSKEKGASGRPSKVGGCNRRNSSYGREAIETKITDVRTAREGERNITLNKAAYALGRLYGKGEIEDVCDKLVEAAMQAGLSEGEARRTTQSGWTKGQEQSQEAREVPRGSEAANHPNNTDEGHAQRLLRAVKGRCHFVAEWGKFVFYDGKQWNVDIAGVRLLAETTAITKQLCSEAAVLDDDSKAERKRLIDEARQSEGLRFKANATALLKTQEGIAISATTLDTHHMSLAVRNGIVDLESRTLLRHDPSYLNTNCLPWLYDDASTCPRWMRFLEEVLPDADTAAFVQRLVGYFLTGSTCEQVLAFCYGSGSNGKTVFVRILQDLLGPFAIQCPTGMLIETRHERPSTDQADLRGKRLGVCAETPSGMYWNEPLVKQLTGSDRMKARRLYQDFEEFEPTHKLIVCGNYKPRVRGQDLGIWRRIRLIPFERTFAEQHRDPHLLDKLRAEMSGILAWAVEGCAIWQRDGLGTSAKVNGATSDYRQESDVLAPFVAECCAVGSSNAVPRGALYQAFAAWMKTQGDEHYPGTKAFADLVRGHGFNEGSRTVNGRRARCWLGIGLLDPSSYTKESDSAELPAACSHEGDFVEEGVPSVTCGGKSETMETVEEGAKKQGNLARQSFSDMAPPTVEEKEAQWLALAGKAGRLADFERGCVNGGESRAEPGDGEVEQSIAR